MYVVGLGRELVDGGGVDGVLALFPALDVTICAAPLTEEIALQTLAVRASEAAALGDAMSASPTTGRGSAF